MLALRKRMRNATFYLIEDVSTSLTHIRWNNQVLETSYIRMMF